MLWKQPPFTRHAAAICTGPARTIKPAALIALLAATLALGAVLDPAYGMVFCGTRNPETQQFEGQLIGRAQGCDPGETQVGEVIDANEGVIELFGNQVDLPASAFQPESSLDEVGTPTE